MVEPLLEQLQDLEPGRGRHDPDYLQGIVRHGPSSAGRKSTFFNPWVDVVPRVVEAVVGLREARLNRPATFVSNMSGKKSVQKPYDVTIYLDAEIRAPLSVVLR